MERLFIFIKFFSKIIAGNQLIFFISFSFLLEEDRTED